MCPEATELLLIGLLFDRINLDSKIHIKYMDTKKTVRRHANQGKFHTWRMELSFMFVWTWALSVLSIVLTWCRKLRKKMQVKKVTAKSKPMNNLVSRCSERNPDVRASTASASPGKTRHESSWTEQHPRTRRPVLDAYSSSYSECNTDKNWSSQKWKSDELMEVRKGRLLCEQPPGLFTQHTDKFIVQNDNMDSYTEVESEMR